MAIYDEFLAGGIFSGPCSAAEGMQVILATRDFEGQAPFQTLYANYQATLKAGGDPTERPLAEDIQMVEYFSTADRAAFVIQAGNRVATHWRFRVELTGSSSMTGRIAVSDATDADNVRWWKNLSTFGTVVERAMKSIGGTSAIYQAVELPAPIVSQNPPAPTVPPWHRDPLNITPEPGTTDNARRRYGTSVGALSAVLLALVIGIGYLVTRGSDDEPAQASAPTTNTAPSAPSTDTSGSEATEEPVEEPIEADPLDEPGGEAVEDPYDDTGLEDVSAGERLSEIVANDSDAVDGLADIWTAQLGAYDADGDPSVVLSAYDDLLSRYPGLRILYSGDWPASYRPERLNLWVLVNGDVTEESSDLALGWCSSEGFDPQDCFARRLSSAGDPATNTAEFAVPEGDG